MAVPIQTREVRISRNQVFLFVRQFSTLLDTFFWIHLMPGMDRRGWKPIISLVLESLVWICGLKQDASLSIHCHWIVEWGHQSWIWLKDIRGSTELVTMKCFGDCNVWTLGLLAGRSFVDCWPTNTLKQFGFDWFAWYQWLRDGKSFRDRSISTLSETGFGFTNEYYSSPSFDKAWLN
jgi:hypothetical protein